MWSLMELYKNVESILEKMEIPPRPGIMDQIFLETRQEEPDFLRLATLISEDMSLSASLIKTVNSPFFGLQQRVSSVQDALMLLGLEVASRMVAGILLRHTFPRRPELDELWDASLKVAVLSHWLAVRLDRSLGLRPADAYTFGLLRDCGMAVMLIRRLDYATTLTRARAEARQPFTEVERLALGIDHAMVGSKLQAGLGLAAVRRDGLGHPVSPRHRRCGRVHGASTTGQSAPGCTGAIRRPSAAGQRSSGRRSRMGQARDALPGNIGSGRGRPGRTGRGSRRIHPRPNAQVAALR